MASRYHWLESSKSVAFASPFQDFGNITLNIPAGAVLKRFVVCKTWMSCYLTTPDERGIWDFLLTWTLTYTSTLYGARILHETSNTVPMAVYTYYDSALNSTQPHCYFHGGDREFGFEGKTSYGQSTGPAATLALTGDCSTQAPYRPPGFTLQGIFGAYLKALYYL